MATAVEIDLRVPQIRDPEEAIRMYYTQPQLGKRDCMKIFGCSENAWWRLKKAALETMRQREIPQWNGRYVSTVAAFEAWGIDIQRLERGVERVRKVLGG